MKGRKQIISIILRKESLLGIIPDEYIARKYGISCPAVRSVRKKLKIGVSHLRLSRNYPRKIDLKAIILKLGTVSDAKLARKYDVSRERIRQLRKAYDIPKYEGAT